MKFRNDHHLWMEFREFTPAIKGLLFFSLIITLMYLLPAIYMQLLFERVMSSRNLSTLTALVVIVVFLNLIWSGLEAIRQKTMQRIAFALDEKISVRVFDALNRQTDNLPPAVRATILQDINTIRDFVGGHLLINMMDCFFVPVIILGAFLFHPVLGATLFVIVAIVAALAYMSQVVTQDDIRRAAEASGKAAEFGRAILSNAESIRPHGMLPELIKRWRKGQREAIGWQHGAAHRAEWFANALRLLRHLNMPIMATCGVLLFLSEKVGAGVIFAASILVIRAVSPVDAVANSWRILWNAILSADRLDLMLRESAKHLDKVPLPPPAGPLVVSRVAASPPNRDATTLTDVSFSVMPGHVVAVVGSSGAGKSTLARVLVGAWPIKRGSIMLDGHELSHWDQDLLGQYVGYVAQDVELLPGTVAENIARFQPTSKAVNQKLIDAVRLAAVQDIIGKLPEGLNTRLGAGGHTLSSGQKQRVALARAVYGEPRLVVLDEPNSNLDAAGEQQLATTITQLKNGGAIVILITHRMNMLAYCDQVLVINNGTVQAFGSRDQVLNRLSAYRPKEIADGRSRPASSDAGTASAAQ